MEHAKDFAMYELGRKKKKKEKKKKFDYIFPIFVTYVSLFTNNTTYPIIIIAEY